MVLFFVYKNGTMHLPYDFVFQTIWISSARGANGPKEHRLLDLPAQLLAIGLDQHLGGQSCARHGEAQPQIRLQVNGIFRALLMFPPSRVVVSNRYITSTSSVISTSSFIPKFIFLKRTCDFFELFAALFFLIFSQCDLHFIASS